MASLDEKWKAVDNFESVVVDRERDVVRVTKELCDYRLTIPFAPHMFGSGKTTFCHNYLELVRRWDYIDILLTRILFKFLFQKKYLLGIFKKDPSISSLEKILLGSLDVEPVDCFFYSKCRVFEGIVALRLVLMLSSKNRNELRELLCQLSPIWKQMKLPISTISPIHYMKSVVSSRETRNESNKSRRTFANTEWNKIIRETLYLETIYIPLDATSHSPDIIFKLQSPVEPKVLTVGVACKGRWKSEGIGWSDIIDEAKKFLDPVYDQVLSSAMDHHHCMLIIVSTKLSLNVSNELVPDNCELVILCERDVQMLIDKEILNGLERAFHVSHNPTFWDFGLDLLDRIRNSFLSWQ
ncbi:hypothetical protein Gasu2_09550 [Galdieria sulphuraria]|nr:hypothetical protein Gasu2_09550 [Galdieria sulphuraria]